MLELNRASRSDWFVHTSISRERPATGHFDSLGRQTFARMLAGTASSLRVRLYVLRGLEWFERDEKLPPMANYVSRGHWK
jgi:hypothetical protein